MQDYLEKSFPVYSNLKSYLKYATLSRKDYYNLMCYFFVFSCKETIKQNKKQIKRDKFKHVYKIHPIQI